MTIARHYLPANPDATPLILILGNVRDPFSIGKRFDEVKPFQNPAVGRISNAMEKLPTWMQEYVRVLQSDLEKGRGSKENITDLSFRSLAPLLRWSTFRTREKCCLVREGYSKFVTPRKSLVRWQGNETTLEGLFHMRLDLRRMIEDSEDGFEQFRRFTRSQQINDVPQTKSSAMVEDEIQQTHLEAHRLEIEIRNFLQLQIGELALQESRRSIELSNLQIEEGKRGQCKFSERWDDWLMIVVRICKSHIQGRVYGTLIQYPS